jgi:RNA methyltransferase, TrmH family
MADRRLSTGERRLLYGLRRRRGREEAGLFLAEGVRVCEELLAARLVPRLAVVASSLGDTARGAALRDALAARCELRVLAAHEVAALAATDSPQGVVVAAPIPVGEADRLTVPQDAMVLVLDAVQDPGNFGTLVRSALAFGADAVLSLPGTVDAWNAKAVRSAAGASFHVPIVALAAEKAIGWLREHGFAICVAEVSGTPLPEVRAPGRVALVVGNEGAGVGATLRAAATAAVGIPMRGRAESLNVAVAAGIVLYHFAAQRPPR